MSIFPLCAAAKIGENPAFVKRFAVARWRLSSRRAHSSDPALHAMYRGERPSVAHISGEARWMSNNRHSAAFPFSQTLSSAVLPLASFLSTSTTSHADGGGFSVTTDSLSLAHMTTIDEPWAGVVNVNTTDATTGATALLLPAQNTRTLHEPI